MFPPLVKGFPQDMACVFGPIFNHDVLEQVLAVEELVQKESPHPDEVVHGVDFLSTQLVHLAKADQQFSNVFEPAFLLLGQEVAHDYAQIVPTVTLAAGRKVDDADDLLSLRIHQDILGMEVSMDHHFGDFR